MPESNGSLSKSWRWVKDQIIDEVPQDDALCEFDCSKAQCTVGEWESCERRQCKAAGELIPAASDAAVETKSNEDPSTEELIDNFSGS
ncbi:MAG: hypothetical protein ABSD67_23855 [Terracidiphilus sp.]|jgi:hypothetical protein